MEMNNENLTILIAFAAIIITAAIIYRAKNHELFIQYAVREREQLLAALENITHTVTAAYEEIQTISSEVQANAIAYVTTEEDPNDFGEMETIIPQSTAMKITEIQNGISVLSSRANTMGFELITKRIKKLQDSVNSYLNLLQRPSTLQLEKIENAIKDINLNYELIITTIATEKLNSDNAVAKASLPLYQRQKYNRTINRKIHLNKLRMHHLKEQINKLRNSSQEDLLEEELRNVIGIM